MADWYVVSVKRGQEKKVKKLLDNLQADYSEIIKTVLLPIEQVTEITEGEKKVKPQYLMPGYILLEVEPSDEVRHLVKSTPGVLGILGSGQQPASLSQEEMNNIRFLVEERKEKPAPQYDFAKGDRVEIREGPFANFAGLIEEVNTEKEKIKVSVSIFGRSTLVELEMWQVEKV